MRCGTAGDLAPPLGPGKRAQARLPPRASDAYSKRHERHEPGRRGRFRRRRRCRHPIRCPGRRAALAGGVGSARRLRRARRAAAGRAQVLRAGDVPLPLRQDPHGARPQLHARRRGGALQAGARLPVLHPMGWDAFGLPAENAARERGVHPAQWTYENIATMRAELKRMGLSLDWSREFATCDPEYYGQQQRLFLDFWRAGLVERKESWVNWDPVDGTVLANEQVIDGRGWRSGAPVEKRKLSQWFFSITKYAPELLEALGTLDRWPERVKLMQANWIGRSEGARVRFALAEPVRRSARGGGVHHAAGHAVRHELPGGRAGASARGRRGRARCGRGGVRRRVPAHGHQRGGDRAGGEARLRHRAPRAASLHRGRRVSGVDRQFRADGVRHRRDLRLPERGPARPRIRARSTGCRCCPWCCRRAPIRPTHAIGDTAWMGDGTIFNSGFLDGLSVAEAKRAAIRALEERGAGEGVVNWRLRDWGVSRQRYWGCPIPVIHCDACGAQPVPENQLPVKLPDDVDFSRPGNPLDHHPTLEACRLPALRRAGAARDRHLRHLRRQLLVLRALLLAARAGAGDARGGGRLAAGRPVHRRHRARDPAPALQPLLHPRDERDRARLGRRALRRALHPGHGDA